MRRVIFVVLCFGFLGALAGEASAHGGRTDSSGGHHDRRNGGYHYHGMSPSARSTPPTVPANTEPRSTARSTARTTPRQTSRAGSLSSLFFSEPAALDELPARGTPVAESEPADESLEEKARKLHDYAIRQLQNDKRETAIHYWRRVVREYESTQVAADSRAALQEAKRVEPFRTWQDRSKTFTIEAKFLSLDGIDVYLLRKEGNAICVPLSQLSLDDQQYVLDREGVDATQLAVRR